MKYKAKVYANVVMTVWIDENVNNHDKEIADIDEVTEILDFEIKAKLD